MAVDKSYINWFLYKKNCSLKSNIALKDEPIQACAENLLQTNY